MFVNGKRVKVIANPQNPQQVLLDETTAPAGNHRVAVNWVSPFGPVGVSAMLVRRLAASPEAAVAGNR